MLFRTISDLHLDIRGNAERVPDFSGDDVFTVVCGDTSGTPAETIEWIRRNLKRGVGCSGNHLPYNYDQRPIQDLRDELAKAFPPEADFTYLDAECGPVSKEHEGVLFVGSCMYSNMEISSRVNPSGDVFLNKRIALSRMNDYKFGITSKGEGGAPVMMTPDDYVRWFRNAYGKIEAVLSANEASPEPKPVVLFTHFPLVREVVENSLYVDYDNFTSYGNDMIGWLGKHPSVKCHCCGHCHDLPKEWRSFKLDRPCGPLLVVNNSLGYCSAAHDLDFSRNLLVDTSKWETVDSPEPDDVAEDKKKRRESMLRHMSLFF